MNFFLNSFEKIFPPHPETQATKSNPLNEEEECDYSECATPFFFVQMSRSILSQGRQERCHVRVRPSYVCIVNKLQRLADMKQAIVQSIHRGGIFFNGKEFT